MEDVSRKNTKQNRESIAFLLQQNTHLYLCRPFFYSSPKDRMKNNTLARAPSKDSDQHEHQQKSIVYSN